MTKVIGQVSAVFVGTSPPTNKNLIWRDTSTTPNSWKFYNTSTSAWESFTAGANALIWVAGNYTRNQRVQYYNLELRAKSSFASSNVETELQGGAPKWEVVGGVFSINIIESGAKFICPPNRTCLSTELTINSGGEIIMLTDSVMRSYGTITNNGTITGNSDLIKQRPL